MVCSGHQKWRTNDENSHWTRMRKIGDGHIGTGKAPESRFLAAPRQYADVNEDQTVAVKITESPTIWSSDPFAQARQLGRDA